MSQSSVAAIIAAKNDETRIRSVVLRLCESGLFSDVIVVCDGSTDNTAHEARLGGATHVHSFELKQGRGAAWLYGVSCSRASTLFFVDSAASDLQPELFKKVLEPIERGILVMSLGGGHFALKRTVFDAVSDKTIHDRAEAALHDHCRLQGLAYGKVTL